VLECRQAAAYFSKQLQVYCGQGHALCLLAPGHHLAPRVHDHGVSESFAVGAMLAGLCGGCQPAKVFNGPGAQQYFPMGTTCFPRKRRRHPKQLGPLGAQLPIELRETHVIANGQSHNARRGMYAGGGVAGANVGRLVVVLPRFSVEEVDFAIDGQAFSLGAQEDAAVIGFFGTFVFFEKGAHQYSDAQAFGQICHGRDTGAFQGFGHV